MKVINLYGQPSAGKSTTAAGLFHKMKLQGINCELVTEYAKDMVWREMPSKAFTDQLYITAKQHHRLFRLKDKVDYAITDSPLLLGLAYADQNYFPSFEPLVKEIYSSFDNINIFLQRTKPYNPIGRNQTEQEADAISATILDILGRNKIPFMRIDGTANAVDKILAVVL